MSGHRATLAVAVSAALLAVAALPTAAAGASVGLGATGVTPTDVSTGATTTLTFSANATGVNTSDGTVGANVTVSLPVALDAAGATATVTGVTPNATGATASVDTAANSVVVSWDDAGGVGAETVAVTVEVSGVAVDRTGSYDLTATVDADGDGATDANGPVGTVTAAATASDRSVTSEGAVLYLGEVDVDLTGLDGAAPAGSADRFYGVGGEAEGGAAEADDAGAVDVTLGNGFSPGTYAFEAEETSAFVVKRPNVTDVELYPGAAAAGTEVSGSSVPSTVETLTVDPDFDFGAADDATVIVENANGLDVTGELTADPRVATEDETVTLDVSELDTGAYTVRVEGVDDLDHVNGTATVRIREEARTISVSRTRVARGESTVATVSGRPGALRYVRLPASALGDDVTVSGPTAEAVFASGEGLALVGADVAASVVYAEVSLEEDGFARVEIDTERLDTGTHDVAVATNATADPEATVPVTVGDRDVSVTPARTNLSVGETVAVSGRARGADEVKLYAPVGGAYAPLYEDAERGELAEASVDDDGSWEVDVDTRAALTIPGGYRIVAVADPGADHLGSTDRLAESALEDFDAVGRAPVVTGDPSPSAAVSQSRIATVEGDEVRVTGRAPGPVESVRAYVVSPRGAVDPRDVGVDDDDAFDFDYAAFDTPGTYRILVVSPGRDGTFAFADGSDAAAATTELSGSETRGETEAILRDAYGGAGVDDRLVALNVTATEPRVRVERVGRRDGGDELRVWGTANRENGTTVLLDLRHGSTAVAAGDAAVNASGEWRATLDVSTVDPGTYALRAETAATADTRTVRLGDAATPAATPAGSPAATPTETPVPTATATQSPEPAVGETPGTAERATRTAATGPGFGPLVALVAAFVALLAARRRP
jgi:PGF-CTERM protein